MTASEPKLTIGHLAKVASDYAPLLAGVPVLVAALRILMFSNGDPTVIRVLVQHVSIPEVIFGTLLPAVPLVCLYLLHAAIIRPREVWNAYSRFYTGSPILASTLSVALIVLALSAPAYVAKGYGVIIIIYVGARALIWLFSWWRLRKRAAASNASVCTAHDPSLANEEAAETEPEKEPDQSPSAVGAPYNPFEVALWLITGLYIGTLSSAPWAPLEQVTVEGESSLVYVVGSNDGWVTLLTEDHDVRVVSSGSIEDRIVCEQGQHWSMAAAFRSLFGSGPDRDDIDCG